MNIGQKLTTPAPRFDKKNRCKNSWRHLNLAAMTTRRRPTNHSLSLLFYRSVRAHNTRVKNSSSLCKMQIERYMTTVVSTIVVIYQSQTINSPNSAEIVVQGGKNRSSIRVHMAVSRTPQSIGGSTVARRKEKLVPSTPKSCRCYWPMGKTVASGFLSRCHSIRSVE